MIGGKLVSDTHDNELRQNRNVAVNASPDVVSMSACPIRAIRPSRQSLSHFRASRIPTSSAHLPSGSWKNASFRENVAGLNSQAMQAVNRFPDISNGKAEAGIAVSGHGASFWSGH